MIIHKLLQRQINKYLSADCRENPVFKEFIKAVNESYFSFERDKDLMNHAFKESELEYNEINNSLTREHQLKQQSIANLYKSLESMDEAIDDGGAHDLLSISKFLKNQVEKRKETEKNLLTTVELLKTLLANLQSGILVENEHRKILFTNELFCNLFSIPLSPEMMIGADCTDSAKEAKHLFKNADIFEERIEKILKERKIATNELLETIDNRFLERDYIPIYINDEYKGHLWKYTDVTVRIKTQNLLEQSEERNRLIMNSALNAIITIDTKGKIMFWNNRAETMFGWSKAEVLGKSLGETIIPDRHKEGHNKGIDHYHNTGEGPALNKQLELPAMNKEGKEFPVEISIIPISQNDETFFCSFIQDISERKKAESTLKFQEEKYRNIIANMNLGLIEVDNNEIIQFANQSFAEMSGFDVNEIIGQVPSDIFVFGENFELMEEKKALRSQGISDIYQIPVKNKRGDLKWWAISGAPNFDDKGNLVGSIGIHLDITEQKQLEKDLEKEKIKAEEASKAKEAFLANMSHEIRTPLNAIIGFLRELERQELTQIQKKYIENSAIASKHLLAIINNVLDISKIEAGEMSLEEEDFILAQSINNVANVLLPKAEQKDIQLNISTSAQISKVLLGDSLRIEQILFNLLGNAIKFTQKGSVSILSTLIEDFEQEQHLCLSVIDTGIGMEQKYLDSLFRKFSQEEITVSRKFGGTGLGMAITKELVQLMGGEISVESEKGIGTRINIYLKLKKGNEQNIQFNHKGKTPNRIDGATILLVEDNELNRLVAQNSLQYCNCIVTEAQNGLEALEILKEQNFDIILMDIQMPEMDGIEATKIIRKEFLLDTPIIALTASAFKSEIEKCRNAGMDDYVTKPFDELILLETIAKYLPKERSEHPELAAKLYNLNSLNNLSRGDKEFVLRMISIFIEQTSEALVLMQAALTKDNFVELGRIAHKIKPSIEGLGITSILEEIKMLEKMAQEEGDKNVLTLLFEQIQSTLSKVISALKEDELKR